MVLPKGVFLTATGFLGVSVVINIKKKLNQIQDLRGCRVSYKWFTDFKMSQQLCTVINATMTKHYSISVSGKMMHTWVRCVDFVSSAEDKIPLPNNTVCKNHGVE